MAKFKVVKKSSDVAESPAALFRDLSNRSDNIKYLWAHQKEILDKYIESNIDDHDVAIELPTGAGKTLVGLLIAEYRRRNKGERVAYLCPTRQLAKQVARQAEAYGITASVFTGKQRDYDPSKFASYQQSQLTAITTYSAIFNINPRINSPQTLILDDAHSCETYITGMWSMELLRKNNPELFNLIVDMYRQWIPETLFSDSEEEQYTRIEMVPGCYFRESIPRLVALFDEHIEEDSSEKYAFQTLKNNLHACNIYLNSHCILIRPIIPPTLTHEPFKNVKQRIYMSATLGLGGELERIVGIKKINRIPLPSDWQNRSTGRRLFLIPELSLSINDSSSVVDNVISESKRAVIITPNHRTVEGISCYFQNKGMSVFRAEDIEDGVDKFAQKDGSVLVLSRYDGIDLPDHQCRLLMFWGKPGGVNLQERFLMTRVAAPALLRDRILTRFTQGVGRCTRSDQDYSAVILLGQDLIDFLMLSENSSLLHPELQAELEFGIENSKDTEIGTFTELVQEFLGRTENWDEAEQYISNLRKAKVRNNDPFEDNLKQSVRHEIDYIYNAWNGHWDIARDKAKAAFESLNGKHLTGYQGLWMYLTGDAEMAHSSSSDNLERAKQYYEQAAYLCPSLAWLSQLKEISSVADLSRRNIHFEDIDALAAENIKMILSKWGFHGSKYEEKVNQVLANIKSDDHANFHEGLEFLGKMIGFETYRPTGRGEPDCVWIIGHLLYITFEAKNEQKADGVIGIRDIQQAQGHEKWILSKHSPEEGADILPLIISPRQRVEQAANIHADTLCWLTPESVCNIAGEAVKCLNKIRNRIAGIDESKVLPTVCQILQDANFLPKQAYEKLRIMKVSDMPN